MKLEKNQRYQSKAEILNGKEISFSLSVSANFATPLTLPFTFVIFANHIFFRLADFIWQVLQNWEKKSGDASQDLTRVDEVVPQLR